MSRKNYTQKWHNLPSAYQELLWIQSNGTAGFKVSYTYYINGKAPGFILRFYVRQDTSNTTNSNIFGVYGSNGYRDWELLQRPHTHSSMPNWVDFQFVSSSGNKTYNCNYDYNGSYIQEASCLNGTLTGCDGTVTTSIPNPRSPSATNPTYIGVGCCYDAVANSLMSGTVRRPFDIMYLALYHDSTKEYEFIPCKRRSDGKVGMYDIVHGVFYSSQTSTEFVAGNPV